jgi:hypothetical protein
MAFFGKPTFECGRPRHAPGSTGSAPFGRVTIVRAIVRGDPSKVDVVAYPARAADPPGDWWEAHAEPTAEPTVGPARHTA